MDKPEREGEDHWEIPYHDECGLPVELCVCPNARIKFIDGKFVDTWRHNDNGEVKAE